MAGPGCSHGVASCSDPSAGDGAPVGSLGAVVGLAGGVADAEVPPLGTIVSAVGDVLGVGRLPVVGDVLVAGSVGADAAADGRAALGVVTGVMGT